ncbi:ectonucleoside triphosphate diphosphohydrolase 1 isoform X2 [Delphinus delphis]|uniref:ectonucleoside triphosphate diphosphohydrolase 1 isoform X2 n=1 Tax=Delphinus delphis TaxID=9728 RepID=UPI0028C4021D|nr:ectonucleoside triphosphate diphosphohydrolase 1 isoform X2 [Delphinus delphis]
MEDRRESEVKIFCSKNILGILGFSCVIAVVALLALGLTQNKPLPENVKFGIVLDAGSSHTNLYIYKWPAEKENDTGVVTQIEECKVKGPGISEFAQKLSEIDIYLTACMERARKVIPASQHTETPVYLGATAGMRLLRMENERLADKILAAVAKSISSYPFDFQGARIITGQEEGAYGWITINYLLGRFTQATNGTIRDPCFHSGYRRKMNMSDLYEAPCTRRFEATFPFLPFPEVEIRGTGNYQQCRRSILQLFNTSYCPYSSCSFNGIFLPPLQGNFGAFSAFYYVMEFLNLTSEEQSTHKKMISTLEKFCSRPWEELQMYFGEVKEKYLSEYCFSGTYILALLLNGYHFTAESWKDIHFMGKVRSSSVGWTLGYMLNLTNMIPSEEPLSTPLSHSTYVFLMVLFSLILVIVVVIGIFIFHKPSYFWKDMV